MSTELSQESPAKLPLRLSKKTRHSAAEYALELAREEILTLPIDEQEELLRFFDYEIFCSQEESSRDEALFCARYRGPISGKLYTIGDEFGSEDSARLAALENLLESRCPAFLLKSIIDAEVRA